MSNTTATSTTVQHELGADLVNVQVEDAVTKAKVIELNRSSLEEITRIIDDDATIDLWPNLRVVLRDYKKKHETIVKKPSNIVADPFEQPNPTHAKHQGYCPLAIRRGDIKILWPLSASVTEMLGSKLDFTDDSQKEVFLGTLSDFINKGRILHELAARAVVQISPDIVVKISRADDLTDMHNLHHIHQAGDIPAPEPLGMFSIGKRTYSFMTFIPGRSLESIWTEITLAQKALIREQLNVIFAKLRTLPLPSKDCHLGGGIPVQCQDNRRFTRTSVEPIKNVAQFHDFLLKEVHCVRDWADLLRSSLHDNYRVVMTHGDLHPRNIIVSDAEDVNISGIIDWEAGGGYPEYWEYVTALRTAWTSDKDDWHRFLPERAIGKYVDEKIRDCEIGRVVN